MKLYGKLTNTTPCIRGKISIKGEPIIIEGRRYEGEYEVTPKAYEEQVLETSFRILTQNVTIHKIPYRESINEDGLTAYIAEEE